MNHIKLLNIKFHDKKSSKSGIIRCGKDVIFTLTIECTKKLMDISFLLAFKDHFGNRITVLNSKTAGFSFEIPKGRHDVSCTVPHFSLSPGNYDAEVKVLQNSDLLIWVNNQLTIKVESGDFYNSGRLPKTKWGGICHLQQKWEIYEA